MPMVWECPNCSHMNAHEVSGFNRVRNRRISTCDKCGEPHPEGFYMVEPNFPGGGVMPR